MDKEVVLFDTMMTVWKHLFCSVVQNFYQFFFTILCFTINTVLFFTLLSFFPSLSLLPPLFLGIWAAFWFLVPLDRHGSLGHRGAPGSLSPQMSHKGPLLLVRYIWQVGQHVEPLHQPRHADPQPQGGGADSCTEWLIYSQHSPGRRLSVWEHSTRTQLHTLATFTN